MKETQIEGIILGILNDLWPMLKDAQFAGAKANKYGLSSILTTLLDQYDVPKERKTYVVRSVLECVEANGNPDEARASVALLNRLLTPPD